MSNRTELRTRLREELGDTAVPYIWTDAHLDNLLVAAGEWYSQIFPMQSVAYRDVVAGQRVFDTPPEGIITLYGVELPPGNPLPADPSVHIGDPTGYAERTRQGYALYGGDLYLRHPAAGEEIGVTNMVILFAGPWDRLDPVEQWNGPFADELILLYHAAVAAWEWHNGLSQRQNRKTSTGDQAARYQRKLDDLIAARRRRFGSHVVEVQR